MSETADSTDDDAELGVAKDESKVEDVVQRIDSGATIPAAHDVE